MVNQSGRAHIIVVEAYLGQLEFLDPEPKAPTRGLGLPLEDLAATMECRITVLDWSDWYDYEANPRSFHRRTPYPATRPVQFQARTRALADHATIERASIPAFDPDRDRPLSEGLSPRSYGLLAESDPLFLASYALERFLARVHRQSPIACVILPVFGGLGYVPQLARATGAGLTDVQFATVVTGNSHERHTANGEGCWTRPAITRRQMENVSLALGDLAICFGQLGRESAEKAACSNIVQAPRYLPNALQEQLAAASKPRRVTGPVAFYIDEPMQAASGTLVALDAGRLLHQRGVSLARPIACYGANMRFAPAYPRPFADYWGSRGWVKEMVEDGYWQWSGEQPASAAEQGSAYRVRLFPSVFEFLPDAWQTLAAGDAVLLSRAAIEGFVGEAALPRLAALNKAEPGALADSLIRLQEAGAEKLESLRVELCRSVLEAWQPHELALRLAPLAKALSGLLSGQSDPAGLERLGRTLLDARPGAIRPRLKNDFATDRPPTLTVAVPCHGMGPMVIETIESVWASSLLPDEVILVDDGSRDTATAEAIAHLRAAARDRRLPLNIIRQNNLGLAAARNTALEAASSTHISFLDGDDLIEPEFYRLALDLAKANPWLGGVAAWAQTFGKGAPPGFWNAPQAELPLLLAENTIIVPCLSSVALLRSLGGYDTRQRYNYEDWELAIRIVSAGYPIITIPRYLQRYRIRPDSLLRSMSTTQNQVMREMLFSNHREVVERFGAELAMQTEYRLMRILERQQKADRVFAGSLRGKLTRTSGRIARVWLQRGLSLKALFPLGPSGR